MNRVFLDTAGLHALANHRDAFHTRATAILADLRSNHCRLITSDWVLSEFLGGASRQPGRTTAIRMVDRLHRSSRTEIVPASRDDWDEAYEIYKNRIDKEWSLVDCSSILICQRWVNHRCLHRGSSFQPSWFTRLDSVTTKQVIILETS